MFAEPGRPPSQARNAGILPVGSARWELWRRKALLGGVFRSLGWQQGRCLPPKRVDLAPVVLVGDLPRAVVELELLELREDTIPLLRTLRAVSSAGVEPAREAPSAAQERAAQRRRPRLPPAARRAASSGLTRGRVPRCGRSEPPAGAALGHPARGRSAAPARKTKPATQIRLTSGFTSARRKSVPSGSIWSAMRNRSSPLSLSDSDRRPRSRPAARRSSGSCPAAASRATRRRARRRRRRGSPRRSPLATPRAPDSAES